MSTRIVAALSILIMFGIVISSTANADLNSGLVAYYPFDGNALDASGYGNDATLFGATYTTGKLGTGALHLDGYQDYALVPDAPSLRLSQYTISLWTKLILVSDASGCDSFVRKDWSGSLCSYDLYVMDRDGQDYNFGGVQYQAMAPAVSSYMTWDDWGVAYGQEAIPVGQWTNVVGTYDGANMRIYLNGNQVGSWAWGNTPSYDSSPVIIGGLPSDNLQWVNGDIDEVRIYNRSLSADEVYALYAPEPATIGLLTVGGVALLRNKRK